jgi:RHS repeat-associated protein
LINFNSSQVNRQPIVTYDYDEADKVRTVEDANHNTTTYDYDRLNRQTKIIDANSLTTQINTYDGFGNVKSIKDFGNNITQYEYDKLDRLTKTIDPRSKETTQTYDGLSRVLTITDRNARNRTFAYDINDNLTTETWSNGTQLTYTYDKVGNLKSSIDASSNTTNTYIYDAIYQLTSAATSNSNVKFEYTYDEFGDLTQRQDKQNNSTIAQLNYLYNNNHQLTQLAQSGVGLATQNIDFTYDRLSQLRKVERAVATNPGRLITDYSYDGAGRLEDLVNKFNTTPISNDHYDYDDGNRLNGKTGTDGNSTVAYGNDNQISSVNNTTRPDESYSFNALGIRSGWTTDPLDKRRVLNDGVYQYQYDNEGNLTRKQEISTSKVTTYVWDYRNRLSRVNLSNGSSVEYGYDAEDRRVSKKINGVTKEKYVYDGSDIALVVDASGTIVERYLYGDGVDNVLSVVKAGTTVWSLADRQGSITDLVDASGAVLNHFVYDSFGNRTASTAADFRFGYTGRELDTETGLYYYRARYYDSGLGRFISEDPVGFSAGDTNLYRYVNNNPTNWTDPTGTTISGWLDDALNGVDSLVAGFANVVSFGITNKIRSTSKIAVENQQGLLYNIGTGLGIAASLALNPAGAGAGWAKGLAAGYEGFGTVYGVLESTGNILKGEGSVFDVLNFIPALQLARASKGSRNVSSAIVETDAALTQVAKKTECFVAGTEIQTLDGTKNIEDIHVGDWVLSDDPNTVGEIEYKQVLQTFVKETSNLVDIYIDGEKITTTEEHPFWVPDVGWVAAKDLHAGTLLQTKYESWLDVDKVVKHSDTATVYNFEVQGFHTYFVSDLGLLVHNICWAQYLPQGTTINDKVTAEITNNRSWRSLFKFKDEQDSILYVLRNKETGEIYKVGKTEAKLSNSGREKVYEGRFGDYIKAINKYNKQSKASNGAFDKIQLEVDSISIRTKDVTAESIEQYVRNKLQADIMQKTGKPIEEVLKWDNRIEGLKKRGPGVPFTRLIRKYTKLGWSWDSMGTLVDSTGKPVNN